MKMDLAAARQGSTPQKGGGTASGSSSGGAIGGGVDQIVIPAGSTQRCPPGYYGNRVTGRATVCTRAVGVAPAPVYTPPPAPPVTVSPTITVSPNMQQSFSPQFSPVMQQSSGSGSQSANPEQSTAAPQSATSTGTTAPSGISEREAALREQIAYQNALIEARGSQPAVPAPVAIDVPPQSGGGPFFMPPAEGQPAPAPVVATGPDYMKYAPYAMLALVALGGVVMMNRNKGKRR